MGIGQRRRMEDQMFYASRIVEMTQEVDTAVRQYKESLVKSVDVHREVLGAKLKEKGGKKPEPQKKGIDV